MKIIHALLFTCSLFLLSPLLGEAQRFERYWVVDYNEETGEMGYLDMQGKLRIPYGKYEMCFTDTFRNYAIVIDKQRGLIAIDKNEDMLFEVYMFDNGPDYPSDGVFRFIKDEKIGFVNEKAQVEIPARYDAVTYFHAGVAAFCKGCSKKQDGEHWYWDGGRWGVINRKGKIIVNPNYDNAVMAPYKEGIFLYKNEMRYFVQKNGKVKKSPEKKDR